MKKIALMMLSVLVLASCISRPKDDIQTMENEKNETKISTAPIKNERVVAVADSDLEMLRKNIVVKTMGDDYIVYEYSDVRIDKVAPLASRYCYETNPGKKAYLRDIYMHKNHKRRATFDCVDLASE
ncbi:MAG: hypothetical protein IJ677_06510 [Alphaproteobacteria bacterium]|nr:hypothetical protein [Alphaproteobacteria bacterium]